MTANRDFDRLARAWLDLMPAEAPDRAISAVLHAVETTPQVRPWLAWPTWRTFTMTRFSIAFGALAVTVAVIAGSVIVGLGQDSSIGEPASSPPSASAQPTLDVDVQSLPESMQATWVADAGAIEALGGDADPRLRLLVGASGTGLAVEINDFGATSIVSASGAAPDGEILLVTSQRGAGCVLNDRGRYGWRVTDDGSQLTLEPRGDDCAGRAEVLARTWVRSLDDSSDGGRGAISVFDPAILVTLPSGSFTTSITPDSAELQSTKGHTLVAVKDPWTVKEPCSVMTGPVPAGEATPIAPGAAAFVAHIAGLPGFQVETTDLTVDGFPAIRLGITTTPSSDCPGGHVIEWAVKNVTSGATWGLDLGDSDAVTIIELPDATYLLRYSGPGVTLADEQALFSTVDFVEALPPAP